MCQIDQGPDVEDRIFELLDEYMTGHEICEAVGLDPDKGFDLILKVIKERGTPNTAAARRAAERLAAISFV
jgi:hypothetical protein